MIKRHHANDNPFLIVSPRWIQFTVSLEDTYANQIYQLLAECEDLNAALPDEKKMIEQHCMIERCDLHLTKHYEF